MKNKFLVFVDALKTYMRSRFVKTILILIVVGGAGYFLFSPHAPVYQWVKVERGAITESVALTGNSVPVKSVSLSFGAGGIISHIYAALGDQKRAGQVLAELNMNDLVAGLRQAQANVEVQQAKLEGLRNGTRPEDIAVSQAAVDKAKQDLTSLYASVSDYSIDGYAKANDAVRTQLSSFFTTLGALSYVTADSQARVDSEGHLLASQLALRQWQDALTAIDTSDAGTKTLLQNEINYLSTIRQLLDAVSRTLENAPSLSATTLSAYKTNVSLGLSEVNDAAKNFNTLTQNIAAQKLTISQLQAQLDLKRAGALPTDISAQEAQVAQAEAAVLSASAKIQNAQIIAPISGTITQFDAKIGQLASPNVPLISMMAESGYEVDAGVSETDIGKIAVGNVVTMTMDAFPNERLDGTVFYIAPAETNNQGVITYKVKIAFTKPDPRMKSGLTANIDIQTNHKENILVLPQYAILQNDQGTFVETLEGGVVHQRPIVLGIQDQKGNVEIVSGVTEGEQVINVGLRTK